MQYVYLSFYLLFAVTAWKFWEKKNLTKCRDIASETVYQK